MPLLSYLYPRLFLRRKILTRHLPKLLSVLVLLIFSSCAPSNVNRAEQQGAAPLNSQEIFDIATGNTLRLISSEFDAYVYFSEDGSLSASSIFNNSIDYGTWDITSDDKLCIKYQVWYYGDVNCHSVLNDANNNQYMLFTNNGSLAFTAKASPGNSRNLKIKTKKDKKAVYVRGTMTKGQSAAPSSVSTSPQPTPAAAPASVITNMSSSASKEEVKHTVKTMAQDCPNCNLEDADLRTAYLVGANLKGANLKGADLSRANMRRANLEDADLTGATLLSANLPGANLKGADLSGTDFTGSNLIQADFTGADTEGAIFENTLQEGVKGLK